MQAKHIIAGLVVLVILVVGTYNWINYFKPSANTPAIEAVRPPQQQQGTSSEAAMVSGSPEDQPGPPEVELPPEEVEWPDTVGRNPFLTPGEIELIARGELVEEGVPGSVTQSQGLALPELKLNGLILDRVTGSYRALFGAKAYNTGDQIGLEKIVEITANSVTLEYGGRTRTLLLELSRDEEKAASGINLKKAP